MASRETGGIPITKRNDNWHPSARDLSTTPGGSIYATTPGGSRILYDRNALLYLRNSPLSKTPTNLPVIPGLTTGVNTPNSQDVQSTSVPQAKPKQTQDADQEDLFVMEK